MGTRLTGRPRTPLPNLRSQHIQVGMTDPAPRYATGGAHIHVQKVACHSRELDAERHVASSMVRAAVEGFEQAIEPSAG
jgi:hypothetical protein